MQHLLDNLTLHLIYCYGFGVQCLKVYCIEQVITFVSVNSRAPAPVK